MTSPDHQLHLRDRLHKIAHHENPERRSKRKILSEDSQAFIASTVTVLIIVALISIWAMIPINDKSKPSPTPPQAAATIAK